MAESLDYLSLVSAAEQAAAAEDAVEAERLLRLAQQAYARHGHVPPAVHAATLNNLAVLCERRGDMAAAEGLYRHAYALAASSLPPDDPAVTTSRDNLHAFCEARGVAVEPLGGHDPLDEFQSDLPVPGSSSAKLPDTQNHDPRRPAAAVTPPVPSVAAASVPDSAPTRSEARPPTRPAPSVGADTSVGAGAPAGASAPTRLVAGAVLGLLALLGLVWMTSDGDAPRPTPAANGVRAETAAPTATNTPAPPALPPGRTPGQPNPLDTASVRADPPGAPAGSPSAPANRPNAPTVRPGASTSPLSEPVKLAIDGARLCGRLSTTSWRCDPPDEPIQPGTLFYFTPVKAARASTVVHRWVHEGRAHRTVSLRVAANPASGFRTYSRATIDDDQRGRWTVEARSQDGTLLAEQSFVVP